MATNLASRSGRGRFEAEPGTECEGVGEDLVGEQAIELAPHFWAQERAKHLFKFFVTFVMWVRESKQE